MSKVIKTIPPFAGMTEPAHVSERRKGAHSKRLNNYQNVNLETTSTRLIADSITPLS